MLKLAVIVNILLSFFPGVAVDLLGCYFHGHACLRDRYLKDPVTNLNRIQRYKVAMQRESELIEYLGEDHYASIWECQFDQLVKEDPEMQEFIAKLDTVPPLKVRNALYGGKCDAYDW